MITVAPLINNNHHKELPLVERYRPKTLSAVVGQDAAVAVMQGFIRRQSLPNILMSGFSGVGKTSVALAFVNDFYASFGVTDWAMHVMTINASRENGIETIREKIKPFAESLANPNIPSMPKIVILDEADALTSVAQWALGPIIDSTNARVRYFFLVNYQGKVQTDLQSRCKLLRFPPLCRRAVFELISTICQRENITISKEASDAIAVVAKNDMRMALNVLSSCFVQTRKQNLPITETFVYETASRVEPSKTKALLATLISNASLSFIAEQIEKHQCQHNLTLSQLLIDLHYVAQVLTAPHAQVDQQNEKLQSGALHSVEKPREISNSETASQERNNEQKLVGAFRNQRFAIEFFKALDVVEQALINISDAGRAALQQRAFAAAIWRCCKTL